MKSDRVCAFHLYIYIYIYLYIYIYIYIENIECDSTRKGGRAGEWGGGGEGGPSHRQPKSIGGGETSPPDLGAHLWVHTERPPPPMMARRGWVGIGEIRIGTSDRFGRGPRRIRVWGFGLRVLGLWVQRVWDRFRLLQGLGRSLHLYL